MSSDWSCLLAVAESEVGRTLESLPAPLQGPVRELPVTFERQPAKGLRQDGIEPDTLGLFVGEPFAETGTTTAPPLPDNPGPVPVDAYLLQNGTLALAASEPAAPVPLRPSPHLFGAIPSWPFRSRHGGTIQRVAIGGCPK